MKKAYIELSDICGLNCHFCSPLKNKRGIMQLEEFKSILPQVLKYSKTIALHILGDPLKLENLDEYLKIANEFKAKIELVTSGIYFNKHDFSTLINKPVKQISISLEAIISNNITNVDSLKAFLNFHKNNPLCFVNLRIQENLLYKNKDLLKQTLNNLGLDSNLNLESKRIRLWEKAFLVVKKSFIWDKNKKAESNKFCYGLIEQFGILSNLNVVPCCICANGEIILGNLKEKSLKEILDSSRALNIKEHFKKGIAYEEVCKKCHYKPSI